MPQYPTGPVWEIQELTDPAQRKPYEEDMARSVRGLIDEIRGPLVTRAQHGGASMRRYNANLIRLSMINGGKNPSKPNSWNPTFGSWFARRGRLIGEDACYEIGMRVCEEMGFTIEEAQRIYDTTPEPAPRCPKHDFSEPQKSRA